MMNLEPQKPRKPPKISDTLCRKVDKIDIDKFLESKSKPTVDFIKIKLPLELYYHTGHFLPRNANFLPPYRSWDHKIEFLPGK